MERAITREEAVVLNRENASEHMHFTPYNGYCSTCKADLVEFYGVDTYSSGINITGCPRCHRSYCD